jgi:hypothetical protein
MCDVLLPPGVNPTAVKYIYHIYHINYLPINAASEMSKDLNSMTYPIQCKVQTAHLQHSIPHQWKTVKYTSYFPQRMNPLIVLVHDGFP